MDHKHKATDEIIQLLKSSLSDCDDSRHLLNTLIESLREEDDKFLPEVISLLLGPAVQVFPLDEAYSIILEPVLPFTKNFLSKKLRKNHELIKNFSPTNEATSLDVRGVLSNIEVCVQVLSEIDSLLVYLLSLNRIQVSDISIVPKELTDLVLLIFSHCQKSETEYKEVFRIARGELMALFQQTYKVQVKLFTLLNDTLVFNCAFEEEVQLLVDIVDILHLMSSVVADLDTMSLVAHWKGFAQLTQTYSTYLCSRLDIARPITYLAANIAHTLDNIKSYVNLEKRVMLRALKITGLQLKVLIKLCDQFRDHLGNCHQTLFKCLVTLTAWTSQSLSREGLTAEVAAQVTTTLCAGAAPLLSHLLGDSLFIKNYFQYADKLNSCSVSEQFGYCNLTNMIVKKFIQVSALDEETRKLWLNDSLQLIKAVFKILQQCDVVFFAHNEDVYHTLLTRTAAAIITTTTAVTFPQLEKLLVSRLLQPVLWPAFFASDLLCLIARVGSSELCCQLTVLLSDLCSGWPAWDRCRPEWCYVSWTLSRISGFLADDDRRTFPSRLPSVKGVGADLNVLLSKPVSDESLLLYDSLMERLTILKDHLDTSPSTKAALVEPISQMWLHMTVPADSGMSECSDWFCNLFSVVVEITCHIVDHLDNSQLVNILDALDKMSSTPASVFKCGAGTFLRSLTNKDFLDDADKSLVFSRMSCLFVKLMTDKNPLVKQFSLEAFSHFAYLTKYEEIVADTVAKDGKLQIEITQYLKSVPIVESDSDLLAYIKYLRSSFVHKCKTNKSKINSQNYLEENPCKKLKTSVLDVTVTETLQKIEGDLNSIKEFGNCSYETRQLILKCIANRIKEIVKPS